MNKKNGICEVLIILKTIPKAIESSKHLLGKLFVYFSIEIIRKASMKFCRLSLNIPNNSWPLGTLL